MAEATQQVNNVPTFVAAIITALALPTATIIVAYVARAGDRRTSKSDRVPDVIHILEQQIVELKQERERWQELALRQLQSAANQTEEAFKARGQ